MKRGCRRYIACPSNEKKTELSARLRKSGFQSSKMLWKHFQLNFEVYIQTGYLNKLQVVESCLNFSQYMRRVGGNKELQANFEPL